MNAKSYVPSSGRMYLEAIASTWIFTSRANSFSCCCRSMSLSADRRSRSKLSRGNLESTGTSRSTLITASTRSPPREPVLERVRGRWKPVAKQVLEQQLAEAAARLRRPERLLEPLQVVRAREDLLVRAAELAQAALDLARGLRRALETAVERRGHRLEPAVDLGVALGELGAGLGAQDGQLGAEIAQEPGARPPRARRKRAA